MCFSTRCLQLLLGTATLSCLLGNLSLLHLHAVSHPSLPPLVRPFHSLFSLHPHSIALLAEEEWRAKREISVWNSSKSEETTEKLKRDENTDSFYFTATPDSSSKEYRGTTEPDSTKRQSRATTPRNVEWTLTTEDPEQFSKEELAKVEEEIVEEDEVEKATTGVSGRWSLDLLLRLLLYSSAGLGMLLCFVLLPLTSRLPPALLASSALLLSAALTAWQPFVNFYGCAAIRLLQGVCVFLSLPLVDSLIIEWSTIRERPRFLATLLLSIPFAAAIYWPLSELIADFALPLWLPFAVSSLASAFVAVLVFFFFHQYPHRHPRIDGVELNKIRAGKAKEAAADRRAASNWKSTSFWSSLASSLAFFFPQVLLLTYLPSLLASSQVIDAYNLGVKSALPFISFIIPFIIFSSLPSSSLLSKICNSIALLLTAFFMVLLPIFVHPDRSYWLLPLVLLPLSLWSAGSCRQSLVNVSVRLLPSLFLPLALSFTLVPIIANCFLYENVRREWMSLMLLTGCFVCIGTAPFIFLAGPPPPPPPVEKTLRLISDEEECGLTELNLLPPAGKHLS